MNIAIMSHTKKQDLMVQFCTAYCGVLSKHTICATNATGRMISDATGLNVNLFLSHELVKCSGAHAVGQRGEFFCPHREKVFHEKPPKNALSILSCAG